VSCSLCCHVPIRCAAVFKYDSEGRGVLKDGSRGSTGKSAGGICGLLAQAVSNSEQLVTITAQQRLAVTGGIEGSLVFRVHGLLDLAHAGVGRALRGAGGQLLGGGFEPGMKQKRTNPPIANEAKNGLKNKHYTLAMARTSDPHSASAQFFINIANNDYLNFRNESTQGWGYCVFGAVAEGMDVVNKIKLVKTGRAGGHSDVPKEDVIIERVTVA